jgi:hypothetical protein
LAFSQRGTKLGRRAIGHHKAKIRQRADRIGYVNLISLACRGLPGAGERLHTPTNNAAGVIETRTTGERALAQIVFAAGSNRPAD